MCGTMNGYLVEPAIEVQPAIEVMVENLGDAAVVRIRGEATYDRAEELRRLLRPLTEDGPRLLVLDLAGLTDASSLALGALVELRWRLSQRWGDVRLARLHGAARQLVAAVGLTRYFPIYDSVAEALAADGTHDDGTTRQQ